VIGIIDIPRLKKVPAILQISTIIFLNNRYDIVDFLSNKKSLTEKVCRIQNFEKSIINEDKQKFIMITQKAHSIPCIPFQISVFTISK
jgi:hypothetical protein